MYNNWLFLTSLGGKRKGEKNKEVVVKSHAFLLDLLFYHVGKSSRVPNVQKEQNCQFGRTHKHGETPKNRSPSKCASIPWVHTYKAFAGLRRTSASTDHCELIIHNAAM